MFSVFEAPPSRPSFRRDLKGIGADLTGGATMSVYSGVRRQSVSATGSLEIGASHRHIC